jgi:hypothetical protein
MFIKIVKIRRYEISCVVWLHIIQFLLVCAVRGTRQAFGSLIAARTVACDMAALLYLSILYVADTFDPCSVCPGRNLNHSSIVSYWSV